MTTEERAYNYASTQKPTKLQVGEIAKHYNNGYNQAMQDFLEKACEWLSKNARDYYSAYATSDKLIEDFKNYMQDESEN